MLVYQIAANQGAAEGFLLSAVRKPERNVEDNAPRARGVVLLTPLDLTAMVWRERVAAGLIALGIVLAGAVFALLQPQSYVAQAQVLVRLGQEYVFQPRVGDSASTVSAPDMSAIANAELRLATSPELVRRVVRAMTPEGLFPDLAGLPDAQRQAAGERAFTRAYAAETAPNTPILALSFAHRDAAIAARALNTLIDAYLVYRREMLIGASGDALSGEAQGAQTRYAAASEALQTFLAANNIGDFDSELKAAADFATTIEGQILTARASAREASARAQSLRAQLRTTPGEIELYAESDARNALVQLQLQREQALAQYQDDAPQVRALDRRIQQLQTFLDAGDPVGATRRGPNPVHQQIAGDLAAAQAEARAQSDRVAALTTQRAEYRDRLRSLQEIEPQFRQLLRERSVLETSAQGLAARAEDNRALRELAGRSTDNISVMERATPPDRGESLRWPIAIMALLIGLGAGLAYALTRGFMRRGFPTAASAGRALDAPVLAAVAMPAKGKGG